MQVPWNGRVDRSRPDEKRRARLGLTPLTFACVGFILLSMKNTGKSERIGGRVISPVRVSTVRARRAERTREQILRAGLKVFSEKGFQGATMDDIALELEATKGLIYYHFKT